MSENIRKEFDTRVVDFHLRYRSITPEQHQAHLDALPDDAEHAEETHVRFDNPFERRYHDSKD